MLYARTMAVYKHLNPDGIRFASKSLILFHGASRFLTAFRNDRGVWAFYILIFLWAVRAEAAVPSCILHNAIFTIRLPIDCQEN